MMRRAAALAFLIASLAASAPSLTAHDKIRLRVTPAISREPAFVNVTAHIDRNSANRALEIVAESADFYRSSTISLEGDNAPSTNLFSFKSLPGGSYRISATLIDAQGGRSVAQGSALVVSSRGEK